MKTIGEVVTFAELLNSTVLGEVVKFHEVAADRWAMFIVDPVSGALKQVATGEGARECWDRYMYNRTNL